MIVARPHPARYSPEVLDVLAGLIARGERVHDPFAGTGERLGALCDQLGADYSGCDIEPWPGRDSRVRLADSTRCDAYPLDPFTVVTSPVYLNKRLADYPNGPTPATQLRGRRDYSISLGRPLHPDNLARLTGRPARAALYWQRHAQAVAHWGRRAIVNVDGPIAPGWLSILRRPGGYELLDVLHVVTRRYGGLDNADKRAEFEVVLVAQRPDAKDAPRRRRLT